MSVSIVKSAIIERLNVPGVIYDGDKVPVVDAATSAGTEVPSLFIVNPVVNATFILQKQSFNYRGTADIIVSAYSATYGDGVNLDVCKLIRQCLSDWKPPEVTTFLPAEILEREPLEKYRIASIRFDWIA